MFRIRKKQTGVRKDRREGAIRIERVYNERGCERVSAITRARSDIERNRRMSKVNLEVKLSQFSEYWAPRTVAQFNGHDIMVVKSKGEFVWHSHPDTEDFFLVLKGRLKIELRDQTIELGPGELFVVPKGVEHRPVADEEVHLLLIEPAGTPNTGDKETAAARRII
jgi:mannose-6-phosphate isomerase-like protein (cupin superfamily)